MKLKSIRLEYIGGGASWSRQEFIRFYTEKWGCPVVPINQKKHALVKWSQLYDRLNTPEELQSWFQDSNPWGLAVVLGHDGLFSIDLDTDELYKKLEAAGAFPGGACIMKSARGYHVFMRSLNCEPFSVPEHNPVLGPEWHEFGVGGSKHLSIVPDTPGRTWLRLHHEPVGVDYEAWLKKYIGYTRDLGAMHTGDEIPLLCIYHDDHEPSMFVNAAKGLYYCHGCGAKGTLETLLEDYERQGRTLPDGLAKVIPMLQREGDISILNVPLLKYEPKIPTESLVDGLLETRDRAAIAGAAGDGKTTKILCLVAQAAKGLPGWGRFAVPRPLKIAIIEEELTGDRPADIVRHIQETIGAIPEENIRLFRKQTKHASEEVEGCFESTDKPGLERLARGLIAYRPDLIVLDGWFKFVSNHENDADYVEPGLKWLDYISGATGAAIVVICHTRKMVPDTLGANRFDQISGMGLHRWAKAKLLIRRYEKPYDLYSRLWGSSSNPLWSDLDYLLHWNPETWLTSIATRENTPSELWRRLYPESGKAEARDLLLRAHAVGLTNKDIADIAGVSERMVRYWCSGHSAMEGGRFQVLLSKVRGLERQYGRE